MSDVEEVDAAKEERLKKIWEGDKLGRKADADYLIRFLTHRIEERDEGGKSYVLNINAAWGGGKSFFLERLGQQMEEGGHLVTHVNAWEDDHIEDPLIAVMAAIEAKIDDTVGKDDPLRKDWKDVTKYALPIAGALVAATETLIGGPLEKGRQVFCRMMQNSTTAIDVVVRKKKAVKNFKKAFSDFLGKLNKSRKLPFFILVDEMDRCRPPYAIALLERVKHLFNIDNVVFVFATDTEQLSHSIGAVYGAGFASRKYLHRFFNLTYSFPDPSVDAFVGHLLELNPISDKKFRTPEDEEVAEFCIGCFKDFNLTLRDIEQCMDVLHNVITGWVGQGKPLEGVVMLPLIVAHHLRINIHHPWGDGLLELFEPTIMGNKNNGMGWRVALPNSKEKEQPQQKSKLSCWDLFAAYIKLSLLYPSEFSHKRLIAATTRQPKEYEFSIMEQLKSEYDAGKYTQPQDYIVRSYPDIIASAGRLGKA